MRRIILLAVVSLLVGSGCAERNPQPSVSMSESRQATPVPALPSTPAVLTPTRLTLVYSTASAANSPLQLAQTNGLFRDNGLDVELVHAPGNAGPAALLSGQAQVMSSGCAEAISAIAGGGDFVFLLTTINRMQYVLAGGPNVTGPDSLRGKRLAVSRLGASSHLATKFIIKQLGLDPDQGVVYVQVGNTPERVSALLSGSVDGTILSVDEGTLIGSQPGMRVIVDMTQADVPYCGNGIVTTRQYLRENPESAKRLTRALVAAIAHYKLDRTEGIEATGEFLGEHDLQKLMGTWDTWARMFPEKPYPEPRGLQFVIDEAAQADERARSLTPQQMIDPTWVRELDDSGYIDKLYRAARTP